MRFSSYPMEEQPEEHRRRKSDSAIIGLAGNFTMKRPTGIWFKAKKMWETTFDKEEDQFYEPDQAFFQPIDFSPWDAEQRAQCDDQAVYQYMTQHPDCLKALYQFKNYNRGHTSQYPLSRLVALGASLQTIRAAYKIYRTEFRSTPLHAACSYSASNFPVIQYLLDTIPEMVRQTTQHAFLPIHNACTAKPPVSLDVIQRLVQAYPESLWKSNKLGDTPLTTAQRNASSRPQVIEYLQQQTHQPQPQQSHKDNGKDYFSSGHITHNTTTLSEPFSL